MSAGDLEAKKTLVSFPCQFTFKAMLKNNEQAEVIVAEIVDQHADLCENGLSSRVSKENKYISVSCVAHLNDENQLVTIYQALKNHPSIIMIL